MTNIGRSVGPPPPARISDPEKLGPAQGLKLAAQLKSASPTPANQLIHTLDPRGPASLAKLTSLEPQAEYFQQQPMPAALMARGADKLELSRMSQLSKNFETMAAQMPSEPAPEQAGIRERTGRFHQALTLLTDLAQKSKAVLQQSGSFRLQDFSRLPAREAPAKQPGAETTAVPEAEKHALPRQHHSFVNYLHPAHQAAMRSPAADTGQDAKPVTGGKDPDKDRPIGPLGRPGAEQLRPPDDPSAARAEDPRTFYLEPDLPDNTVTTFGFAEEDAGYLEEEPAGSDAEGTGGTETRPPERTGGSGVIAYPNPVPGMDGTGEEPPAEGDSDDEDLVTTYGFQEED